MSAILDPVEPTEEDVCQAQESATQLAKHLGTPGRLRLEIHDEDYPGVSLPVPMAALRLLKNILVEMAQGNAVAVVPSTAEFTTQQAADFLNVSRPYLVRLVEEGKLVHRKVGTHRRIRFHDLLEYKRKSDEEARRAFAELTAEAQELDLGY